MQPKKNAVEDVNQTHRCHAGATRYRNRVVINEPRRITRSSNQRNNLAIEPIVNNTEDVLNRSNPIQSDGMVIELNVNNTGTVLNRSDPIQSDGIANEPSVNNTETVLNRSDPIE